MSDNFHNAAYAMSSVKKTNVIVSHDSQEQGKTEQTCSKLVTG